jgi:hypothetical protein
VKRGGMHGKDGMPCGKQSIDDEPVRAFDDHR